MNRQELEQKILSELEGRRNKALNRNAINALFGAFTDPIGALGKVFLGRGDAVDAEKQKIEREIILETLCSVDSALEHMEATASTKGLVIDGLIETTAFDVKNVLGVNIDPTATNIRFVSGTHIKTEATRGESLTGLQIGGSAGPRSDNEN